MRHPGQVFSREDLYEMIWGLESLGDNITVAVHMNRLREKLEDDPGHPQLLQTVWGAGWVIGMGLCVSLLANLFSAHIYFMSSLFLGLTVVSIPFVALAEKAALRRRQNFPFALLGTALVVTLTILQGSTGPLTVNMAGLRLVDAAYLFLLGVVAITAMVLPGISGSSIAYHKTVFSHLQPGSRHS